jgi:hypothetical protein
LTEKAASDVRSSKANNSLSNIVLFLMIFIPWFSIGQPAEPRSKCDFQPGG